jgi:hypothetical protein
MGRDVTICYNDAISMFNVHARDGHTVLPVGGAAAEYLRQKGWFAASDGHLGSYALVDAPIEAHAELAQLFGTEEGQDVSVALRKMRSGDSDQKTE